MNVPMLDLAAEFNAIETGLTAALAAEIARYPGVAHAAAVGVKPA